MVNHCKVRLFSDLLHMLFIHKFVSSAAKKLFLTTLSTLMRQMACKNSLNLS